MAQTLLQKVDWLFLDLNAYFASVEQEVNPALRGLPIAVVPVMADSTCCIAASYEAKAFGVKTGTLVAEAKALCPSLRLVEARQVLYVDYHTQIVKAVESCVPVDSVLSIDEMICSLSGSQREPEEAVALAHKIKRTIFEQVGSQLRCSIGLAPNRFLAKVASDMQKPDGLTLLRRDELPEALYALSVRDLPGIGGQLESRLHRAGIRTVQQLCQLSMEDMRQVWGGIQGERLWNWLRGTETVAPASRRHSIGHSHVLPPASRDPGGAYQVAKRLLSKAAVRLRKERFWTTGLAVGVQFSDHLFWEGKARFTEAQDTPRFLKALEELWRDAPRKAPLSIAVTLYPLIEEGHHTASLFDNPKQEKISLVMDAINEKYGKDAAYFASLHDTLQQAPTRIAFSRIPDVAEF